MELEQATAVDLRKDIVRSSVYVLKFEKHLKMAGGHTGRNVMEITIKMKTIVRKPLMIKIIKLHLRNSDNTYIQIYTHTHTYICKHRYIHIHKYIYLYK